MVLQQVRRETVQIGGEPVVIRVITGRERHEFLALHHDAGEDVRKRSAAARYIVGCALCNGDGGRMYPPGHEDESGDLPGPVFEQALTEVLRVNAMTAKEDRAEQGKSEASPSGGSGS